MVMQDLTKFLPNFDFPELPPGSIMNLILLPGYTIHKLSLKQKALPFIEEKKTRDKSRYKLN